MTEKMRNYSGTQFSQAVVHRPQTEPEVCEIFQSARARGVPLTIRGSGLSYGDSAMPARGAEVLDLSKLSKILDFDKNSRTITVQAGVRLAEILILSLPENLILPVVPGEHQVTVGGAIANNVHGKWSWDKGNFGSCVIEMKVLTGAGEILTVGPASQPKLFESLISGSGMIAAILSAKLQLVAIPSPYVDVSTVSTSNLNETIRGLELAKDSGELFLAWVDNFPTGENLGRGFVEIGKFVRGPLTCDSDEVRAALYKRKKIMRLFPFELVWIVLRPVWGRRFVSFLNKYLFWSAKWRSARGKVYRMLVTDFLFIHKKVPELRLVYGRHGYYEFQPLIPRSLGAEGVKRLIQLCQRHKFESLLCAIKIHQKDRFPLSYEGDGYSFGIDVHAGEKSIDEVQNFLKDLGEYLIPIGAKMFLAKDQWIPKEWIGSFFPKAQELQPIQNQFDPQRLLRTRLTERTLEGLM